MSIDDITPAQWDEMNRRRIEENIAKEIKDNDPVNSPSHYTHGKWEVIEVLEEYFATDPLLWQVGKYILRHEHKENSLQDLKKAAWYLNRKITKLQEQQNG